MPEIDNAPAPTAQAPAQSTPGGDAGHASHGGDMDVDALLAGIESPSAERPMSAPPAQPAPQPVPGEVKFTWNGKEIRAPLDRATQWAAQGYDYSQKMQAFNSKIEQLKAREAQLKELQERYGPIDEYAKQNKDWWNHVETSWKTKSQVLNDPQNPLVSEIQQLKDTIRDLSEFKSSIVSERTQVQQLQEDQKLDQEVASIRKAHANIDWDSTDESGMNLERRVLDHAVKIGTNSFRAAFRDYFHDNLVKLAQENAKEKVSRDIQDRTKKGILGTSQTPFQPYQAPRSDRDKSYNELLDDALKEIGAR